MKLLLTTFCAALFISPLAFAESKKCDKKCDKEKEAKEGTIIAHCGKCKKDGEHKDGEKKEEAKKEGTMIAEADGKKCDKKCDKEEKKEGTLADCKKCDKDKKKEEEKKEGTLA
jgi:hypothetical protein